MIVQYLGVQKDLSITPTNKFPWQNNHTNEEVFLNPCTYTLLHSVNKMSDNKILT